MGRERIEIIVTEQGIRIVGRRLDAMGNSAKKTAGILTEMKKVLAGLSVVAAIRGLVRMADSLTNMRNRMRLVTSSTQELNKVQKELFEIANRTRSSFEATGTMYSRVALAVKDMGISSRDTLQFVESLNQATILSGASAQEANNALIQLSQGLASGTLRGDELRSVLEQLPFVADIIAKDLKITRGELRKFGTEGKISAEVVLTAFKNAREEIAEKFAKTIPTISQSFVVFSNKMMQAIGVLDTITGASSGFAQTVILLANNLEILAKVLITVVAAFAAFKIAALISSLAAAGGAVTVLTTAFTALRVVLLANPIGIIITALAAATTAFILFGDAADTAANFARGLNSTTDDVATLARIAAQAENGLTAALKNRTIALGQATLATIRDNRAQAAGKLVAAGNKLISARGNLQVAEQFGPAPAAIFGITFRNAEKEVASFQKIFNDLTTSFITTKAQIAQISFATVVTETGAVVGSLKDINDKLSAMAKPTEDASTAFRTLQENMALGLLTEQEYSRNLEAIGFAFNIAGGNGQQFNAIMQQVNSSLDRKGGSGGKSKTKMLTSIEALGEALKATTANFDQTLSVFNQLQQAEQNGIITTDAYTDALERLKNTFIAVGGSSEQFAKIVGKNTDSMSKQLKSLADQAIDGLADAFVELLFTGKSSFAELAISILKDITKMIAKFLILQFIKSIFPGFSDGGSFGGGGQVLPNAKGNAFATGGTFTNSVVSSPTPFQFANGGVPQLGIMGEAGPEAIMPLSRGRDGRLGVEMNGGGGGINQRIVIVHDGSTQVIIEKTTPEEIRVVATKVVNDLTPRLMGREITNSNSHASRAIAQNTNASRKRN